MEEKGLRVNAGKTTFMICGIGLDPLQASYHAPSVTLEWAATASAPAAKCSGLKRWQKTLIRCTWCRGTACPLYGRLQWEVQVGPDKLEVVASFCHLGDLLSAASGCELSTTTRVRTAWKKFKELLPVLSSRHLSFKTRGSVYSTCVRSDAPCLWDLVLTKPKIQHLQWNDKAMIRQICSVKSHDIVTTRSSKLFVQLGIETWTSSWRREGSAGMDMWNAPMVQSWQPLTYRLMERVGLGGPRLHGSSWQRGIAEMEAFSYRPSW